MTDADTPRVPEARIGIDEDGLWCVALADQFGWVAAGDAEPLPDSVVATWTQLVPADAVNLKDVEALRETNAKLNALLAVETADRVKAERDLAKLRADYLDAQAINAPLKLNVENLRVRAEAAEAREQAAEEREAATFDQLDKLRADIRAVLAKVGDDIKSESRTDEYKSVEYYAGAAEAINRIRSRLDREPGREATLTCPHCRTLIHAASGNITQADVDQHLAACEPAWQFARECATAALGKDRARAARGHVLEHQPDTEEADRG